MKSGTMRHILTWQRKTEALDSFRTAIETWVDDSTLNDSSIDGVYCAYEVAGTREFPSSFKRHAETTARFRIRYQAGIDPDVNRILFTLDPDASPPVQQTYNIFPPIPAEGNRRELIIEAVETD